MKNKVLVYAFILFSSLATAQSAEHKWNVGIHGGFSQYNGDLGNGFYHFEKAFYGHVGLSGNRYLTPHWDGSVLITRGVVGYLAEWVPDESVTTHFITNLTTFNLLARYNFFNPEFFLRPYLTGGAGVLLQEGMGDSYIGRKINFAPQAGVGTNFHFGEFISLQIQEMLMYTSADNIDSKIGGLNDMYLFHSVGLTFNIGKFKMGPSEPDGVGKKIDKCPDIKQQRNKATRTEGQALRKEKEKISFAQSEKS